MITNSSDRRIDRPLHQDPAFKRIASWSTGLGLAAMVASLASIQIGSGHGLQFRWHWTVLLWIIAAIVFNARGWNLVWKLQANPSPEIKRKLKTFCVLLLLLGCGAFLYPIRFIAQSYRTDITQGLLTAIIPLGAIGWFIYLFGKGFLEQDEAHLNKAAERQAQSKV